jgi:hypothetical protein
MRANAGLPIAVAALAILAIITINLYVYPIIPQPWGGQVNQGVRTVTSTISKVVTFTIDAAGRLTVEIRNVVNITAAIAQNPYIDTVATVHTKETQITGAELQATMRLLEINFTAPIPIRHIGPDQTFFTWAFPLDSLSVGVATLTAAVVLSVIGCGSCANTTIMVPVDLRMTASAGSGS